VETANSIWDAHVKDAIDKELAAKGWTQVPSGGDTALVAIQTNHTKQQLNTFYNGRLALGRFRRCNHHGSYKMGTLVVDMFAASSKNLIWRGTSSGACRAIPKKIRKSSIEMSRTCLRTFHQKQRKS
jgi:hypothetical protein